MYFVQSFYNYRIRGNGDACKSTYSIKYLLHLHVCMCQSVYLDGKEDAGGKWSQAYFVRPSWTGVYLAVWISRPRVTFDFALSDWLSLCGTEGKKLTVGGQRKTNEKLKIPEVKIARSGMSEKLWPWFFEVQWSLWQDIEGVSSERRGLWAVSQVICVECLPTYVYTSKFWPVCILTKCDKQWFGRFETCGHAAHNRMLSRIKSPGRQGGRNDETEAAAGDGPWRATRLWNRYVSN